MRRLSCLISQKNRPDDHSYTRGLRPGSCGHEEVLLDGDQAGPDTLDFRVRPVRRHVALPPGSALGLG